MNHAKSLLMSVRTVVPSYRHPARMLRPEQHFHIAAAYDSAAFDISFPLTPERPLLEKQIGFVCLPAFEKRESKRGSRNKKPMK